MVRNYQSRRARAAAMTYFPMLDMTKPMNRLLEPAIFWCYYLLLLRLDRKLGTRYLLHFSTTQQMMISTPKRWRFQAQPRHIPLTHYYLIIIPGYRDRYTEKEIAKRFFI